MKRTSPGPKRKSPGRAVSRSTNVPTAAELPVTRAMLGEARTELLERIAQVQDALEAKIHEVKAEIHEVKGGMARMLLLLEEQNARNKVVLDGLVAVMARQERAEHRIDRVEETVRSLASVHP